jgi:hypothetical protein
MPEVRDPNRPPVTLEQLLQLKRSERPEPAFWEEFDRELRRRQLASVVAPTPWYTKLGRAMLVGIRRSAPVSAAAVAAVVGFLALQRPSPSPTGTVALQPEAGPTPAPTIVADSTPVMAVETPVEARAIAPVAEQPVATGEPRFVVHEFVATSAPTRTFVSVTSPNTFSSPAYDASVQMVNTLTSGYGRRAVTATEAGRF